MDGYKDRHTIDPSQSEACAAAAGNAFTPVQGPPGTGKTAVRIIFMQFIGTRFSSYVCNACIYLYICISVSTHTVTHRHIYTYIHTHIHTYTYIFIYT